MLNLRRRSASHVYLWDCNSRMLVDSLQVCNRGSPHINDLSKEMNPLPLKLTVQRHARGYIWTLPNEFPRSSKRQCFCLKLSFQRTSSLQDWNYCSKNLFFQLVLWPPMVWMYILMNVLLIADPRWWQFSMMCSVLLSELLPVSFNQEQQLACT